MNNEQTQSAYEGWAIVELMGHNTIAGYVCEQSQYGVAMLRVDVPGNESQAPFSKFYGGSSIYGITPTTEEIARHAASRLAVRPVSHWTVPDPKPRLVDSVASGMVDEYDRYEDADDDDGDDEIVF